jgi:DNA-binding transcriptional LysR family regulator
MDGHIDVAIAEICDSKSLNITPLLDDEILAVLPQKHPLSERDSVSLEELTKHPFISYSTGGSNDKYRGWPEHTLGSRIHLDARYSCTSDFAAIQMVSHNLGVTVASRLMLDNYPLVTKNIPLFPAMHRSIGVAVRAGQPALPAARSFINYVVQIVDMITKNV